MDGDLHGIINGKIFRKVESLIRTFSKFTNYLKVDESFIMNNNDEVVVEYKLFSNSETLKINVEIMKQSDSNPRSTATNDSNTEKSKISLRDSRGNC